MSSKRITERDFFTCEAEELAKKLIGKIICHEDFDGKEKFVIKARITATEAYRKVDSCLDDNRTQKTTVKVLRVDIFIFTMREMGDAVLIL